MEYIETDELPYGVTIATANYLIIGTRKSNNIEVVEESKKEEGKCLR